MHWKKSYNLLSLLIVFSLIFSSHQVAQAAPATDDVGPEAVKYVKLLWFYKPPADGNLSLLAKNFSSFILTRTNESTRNQLLTLGAQPPMLEYLRFDGIQDPGSCTAKPYQNQVANRPGDFCSISKNHADWFLLTTAKTRTYRKLGAYRYYLMDPGNLGWRNFFLVRAKESLLKDPKWNGVFLDNTELTLNFHIQAGEKLLKYPTSAGFQTAVLGMVRYLSLGYFKPAGKILSANLVSRPDDALFTTYMTYLDGAMHEGWAIDVPNRWRPVATWEKHLALVEKAQAQGKFVFLVAHGTRTDLVLQRFAFASYLLVTNGRASFRYGQDDYYTQAWLYPNYSLALGTPLGARFKVGTIWQRNFTNGTVKVDPALHTASITLKTP